MRLMLLPLTGLLIISGPIYAQEAVGAAMDGPERAFTGEDLFNIAGATDPQISPDGSKIAYVRISAEIMTDRSVPSIWLVDVRSGQHRPLVTGPGAHLSPRWSPDSTRLAYVSTDGGNGAQLHVLWLDGGTSAKVTSLPESPDSIEWSPNGQSIAYLMHVPGTPLALGTAPAKPEGAEWAKPLQIIDRVTYRNDDSGYVEAGFSHVFVVAATGGAPRQLTFDNFNDTGPISWAKNGNAIFFSANRNENWELAAFESELFSVNLESGALAPLTNRAGPDFAPAVSPDGRKIAYLGFDDVKRAYENNELYVMDLDGGNSRSLTASLDRSVNQFQWSGNGALLFSYDDRGDTKVARIDLSGKHTDLVSGLRSGAGLDRPYTGGSFAASDAGVIAYTGGSTTRPADVYVKASGTARQLTWLNENWLAEKTLGPVRKIPVTAPDGRSIDAWLVEPAGRKAGERLPLILEIHGGPNAAYGPAFSTDYQLYAAAGYAVLYTNPRGSTSYGEDFAGLIDRAYPGDDYFDLMAAVDAAVADGVADPDNLFVTGGSGGGILTAWIIGKTERFKAAASQKPVINWTSEALTADLVTFAPYYWFTGLPWENQEDYWARSPLSIVGNVKTPTLVVVGAEDFRTPVSESEQYYAALKLIGVDTALIKVPDASHGGFTSRPSQSAAKASAIIAWFDKYRTSAE